MSLWAKYRVRDRVYCLNDTDVIWLARALWGECGSNAEPDEYMAVAFCMMQRYLRWPTRNPRWPTFWQMMRRFSQPINPIWIRPSEKRRKRYPEACSRKRLRRRKKISTRDWRMIPALPKRAALTFACGFAASPVPFAVDFGADWLVKRQGKQGVNIGDNVFLDNSQTKIKFKPGVIQVEI